MRTECSRSINEELFTISQEIKDELSDTDADDESDYSIDIVNNLKLEENEIY